MANVNEFEFHPRIIAALKKAHITDLSHVLSLSASDLVRLTRLSSSDVLVLQKTAANAVPRLPMVTAFDLWRNSKALLPEFERKRLSVGCHLLDHFLKGGVLSQALTEISGESASGKTQLCLQLCLTVQMPVEMGGLEAGAIYVCTEDAFPSRRLKQMIDVLHKARPSVVNSVLMDNVYIEHSADVDDLWKCISQKIPFLLRSGKVKLVIIDSLAAVFRSSLVEVDLVKRARQLSSVGALLSRLSNDFRIPIVVVNQVSDIVESNSFSSTERRMPSLGIVWGNQVTMRLMLSRTSECVTLEYNLDNSAAEENKTLYSANVRCLQVIFAPHLPNTTCRFIITQGGLQGYG